MKIKYVITKAVKIELKTVYDFVLVTAAAFPAQKFNFARDN